LAAKETAAAQANKLEKLEARRKQLDEKRAMLQSRQKEMEAKIAVTYKEEQ